MGLGRFGGGIAVARWLAGEGARVLVTDKDPASALADSVRQLEGVPVEFRLGEHRVGDFTGAELVVASPAVPLTNEFLGAALAAGVPVTTEMRLFVERCPARRVLGVTGTKGKSTTTSMLGAMLSRRFKTWVGGNIGKSLLDDLPRIAADDLVVLELSSYMLEHLRAMRWSPHVGLVTMLAQDHVEWHGSVEAYYEAKRVLLAFQTAGDYAVLNRGCAKSQALAQGVAGQVKWFGGEDPEARPFDLALPGVHNQVNAQGAFAAARCLGVTWDEAQAAMKAYKGLPHRLELVHEAGGVRYYNDSIATIPEAAVAALDSFPSGRVIQIVGGRLKDVPVDGLCDALAGRAKAVLCVGEKGPELAAAVVRNVGHPPVRECGTIAKAVEVARGMAAAGDVVLMSPGCKSQDQFVNFEARGEAFARAVREGA